MIALERYNRVTEIDREGASSQGQVATLLTVQCTMYNKQHLIALSLKWPKRRPSIIKKRTDNDGTELSTLAIDR